ncbi:MAG: ethanolamine ammonia-lyase subunit EutC [Bacteroidetes bacterium]|nr:MAG: ethanolamine ammonia-lyase subunit EutC [Bacteroidota bacterium]
MNKIEKTPHDFLKQFTDARIGLGIKGSSLPTQQLLAFNLACAEAKDAVKSELNLEEIATQIQSTGKECILLQSSCSSKTEYLQRPDLGRKLEQESKTRFPTDLAKDIAIVVCDGLAANAISTNAFDFIKLFLVEIQKYQYTLSPISLVKYGRVAIGDDIGASLNSKLVVVLIGERPGLSATDSMGIYLTFHPKIGLTDDKRNCISNIRPKGLPIAFAVDKLIYLINEAFRLQLSGVDLKDNSDNIPKLEA